MAHEAGENGRVSLSRRLRLQGPGGGQVEACFFLARQSFIDFIPQRVAGDVVADTAPPAASFSGDEATQLSEMLLDPLAGKVPIPA